MNRNRVIENLFVSSLAVVLSTGAVLMGVTLVGGCEDDPFMGSDAGMRPDGGMMLDAGPVDDFTMVFESSTFQMCADCHAPGAPGFVDGTEATQDWSSRDAAFTSLQGTASGLIGNFADCNGAPLVGATADTSLIIAILDEDVRAGFSLTEFPDCNVDAIADETLRVGAVDAATLDRLKAFINAGGFAE